MQPESIMFIATVVVVAILLASSKSEKKTRRERYAEGAGILMRGIANTVSNTVSSLAESEESKIIREAKQEFRWSIQSILRISSSTNACVEDYSFYPNEAFEEKLRVLGITVEEWLEGTKKLFYLTILGDECWSCKSSLKQYREEIITGCYTEDYFGMEEIRHKNVLAALSYFKIDSSEFIEYGNKIIVMHDLLDDPIIEKFDNI